MDKLWDVSRRRLTRGGSGALVTTAGQKVNRSGRRVPVLLLTGSAAVVAGALYSWDWLVALGLAPLLLSVLPCIAMCALGCAWVTRVDPHADEIRQLPSNPSRVSRSAARERSSRTEAAR